MGHCPKCGSDTATYVDGQLIHCNECEWSADNIHDQVDLMMAELDEKVVFPHQTPPEGPDKVMTPEMRLRLLSWLSDHPDDSLGDLVPA